MSLTNTISFADGRTESRSRAEPKNVQVKAFRFASVTFNFNPPATRALHVNVLSGVVGTREMPGQRGMVIPESDPRWGQVQDLVSTDGETLGGILKRAIQAAARSEGIIPPVNDSVETP